MRKDLLVNGQYYHIFNRSIAKYQIFNDEHDYKRFKNLIIYYRYKDLPDKYSRISQLQPEYRREIMENLVETNELLVEIVAYCIMPTHFHLILKQIEYEGIVKFMKNVSDSYARYFNILHGRKGPLYEGHFKNVLVKTDEQVLHLSRYLHINAVTAGLVKKPEDWEFSSYLEYINKSDDNLCQFKDIIDVPAGEYRKFVLNRISYQKELSKIKHLLLDNYSG